MRYAHEAECHSKLSVLLLFWPETSCANKTSTDHHHRVAFARMPFGNLVKFVNVLNAVKHWESTSLCEMLNGGSIKKATKRHPSYWEFWFVGGLVQFLQVTQEIQVMGNSDSDTWWCQKLNLTTHTKLISQRLARFTAVAKYCNFDNQIHRTFIIFRWAHENFCKGIVVGQNTTRWCYQLWHIQ